MVTLDYTTMTHQILFFLLTFIISAVNSDKKIVCYYGSWAVYRPGLGKFPVEQIDPFICTHLIYGFVGLSNDNTIRSLDPWNDMPDQWGSGLNAFGRFNELKNKNPNLKTILAIGGWNEGSTKYSAMAENPQSRQKFVNSAVEFLRQWKFDGLDMDWEYPATRGGKPHDKQNFVSLLKELKQAFAPHNYLLTAAVAAGKDTIDVAYDIPEISKYLDFINVMTYDYHGAEWSNGTGHNSPLYALPNESEYLKTLTMNYSINYWIEKGAPREKLILGMALYGRSFTLQNPSDNGLGAVAPQKGTAGPYTREAGMLGYNEICEMMNRDQRWTVKWVDHYEAPYTYLGNQWISYDNIRSIQIKANYAISMNLGGAMVWSIETDDFHGNCHGQNYPLLHVIHTILRGPMQNTNPPPLFTTTTRKPVTNAVDPFPCTTSGWFRHPDDCTMYWRCYESGSTFKKQAYQCSDGTVFDLNLKNCNWPSYVPGC